MASITKLPSGNWRALIRKRGSEALSETFKKKKDAENWAKAQELKIDSVRRNGKAAPPAGSTFSDFIRKYTEQVGAVSPFLKNKAACLKRLSEEFEGVLMSDMTELRLDQFVDKRSRDRNEDGEIISGVTIAGDLSYIGVVLSWAKDVKHYDVDETVAKKVRAKLKKRGFNTRSEERTREITTEELEEILAEYEKKAGRQIIPMQDIILVALHSAMRQDEICRIRIEDFKRDAKTVMIRDRKHPEKKKGNNQTVPLFEGAMVLAEKYAGDRKAGKIFNYNSKSVSSSFTRVCKKCGIEDLHFHDLRHSAIGILFELGLQIHQVAVISGHSDWKMLKRYTHIDAEDVHAALEKREARRRNRQALMEYLNISSN